MSENTWFLRTRDETFGPESKARLVEWARMGRILPGYEVSDDEVIWQRVEDVPFLDMRFSIDIGDGNPRGPFNRAAAESLISSGRLPKGATIVEVREPFAVEERPVEEEVRAVRQTKPEPEGKAAAEPKVVEKIVRVEVPVEKIVEKIVVDEKRVKELEDLLALERHHSAELQDRCDEASKSATEATLKASAHEAKFLAQIEDLNRIVAAQKESLAMKTSEIERLTIECKEAQSREALKTDKIAELEEELKRLPQAASEVADIQAAMYGIMTSEAEEIGNLMELEKREFEEVRLRFQKRADRLLERRQAILKRAGTSVEEMTRKALLGRPEDPRTAQLRKDYDELCRLHDRQITEAEKKIRDLTDAVNVSKADLLRLGSAEKDITQLRQEAVELREALQRTEKDLLNQRQRNEELERQQETQQQALMTRLASLESTSIGTAESLATNQSREARLVKLPSWMSLKR